MEEGKVGDVRIYIVSIFFFACIVAGGVFLCLFMFQPEAESVLWYPVAGMILVGIPWIFWFVTCIYRCCAYCFCQNNGGNANRVQSSAAKTPSFASPGPLARSMNSPLKSSNGDQRHVQFREVIVLGSGKNDISGIGDENLHEDAKGYPGTEHEGKENSRDNIVSDKDHVSAASGKGEAPLIISVSS